MMKKVALVFPGQGSQYVGMGKDLYTNYDIARETFETANEVLGFDLTKLCFEGDLTQLTKTENTQPAILTCSVAAYRVLMQEANIDVLFYAGHSLGEISALTCTGAIEFSDALNIVRKRGLFMQSAVPEGLGGMAAISGSDPELIRNICKEHSNGETVVISNYNAPDQQVISGNIKALNNVTEQLKKADARVIPLKVSAPFHSPLMKPAADSFKKELNKYSFKEFKAPVISNVTAQPYDTPDMIIENLTRQITEPVQWVSTVEYLYDTDIELVLEVGPKTVIQRLIKKIKPEMEVYSIEKQEHVISIKELLSKNNKNQYNGNLVTKCMAIAVCTRNRNWDNEEYKKGVIEPYNTLKKISEELEESGKEPSKEDIHQSLKLLKKIFTTKKVPEEEQEFRFNQIFDQFGKIDLPADMN